MDLKSGIFSGDETYGPEKRDSQDLWNLWAWEVE